MTDKVIQAKSVLRPLEGGWGLAIAAGTFLRPRQPAARAWPGNPYLYVPLSIEANGEAWLVHVNAGVARDRDARRTVATWGVGNEVQLPGPFSLVAEAYALDRSRPFYQLGVRYSIVKDRVQMDAAFGNRLEYAARERWFSIGLRVLAPPFLP